MQMAKFRFAAHHQTSYVRLAAYLLHLAQCPMRLDQLLACRDTRTVSYLQNFRTAHANLNGHGLATIHKVEVPQTQPPSHQQTN